MVEDDGTSHGIRTVSKARRSLDYFDRVNGMLVYLHTMLVTPLLTFLPNSIVYYQHTVET